MRRVCSGEVFCYGAGFVEGGAVVQDDGGDASPGVAGQVGRLLKGG